MARLCVFPLCLMLLVAFGCGEDENEKLWSDVWRGKWLVVPEKSDKHFLQGWHENFVEEASENVSSLSGWNVRLSGGWNWQLNKSGREGTEGSWNWRSSLTVSTQPGADFNINGAVISDISFSGSYSLSASRFSLDLKDIFSTRH